MSHPQLSSRVPLRVAGFTVLSLSLQPLPSYPTAATHHIYIRPHEPRVPDSDTPRSLFAANVPIDATEASFRSLFADQLGGARVERVEFDDTAASRSGARAATATAANSGAKAGKKRKRKGGKSVNHAEEQEVTGPHLPSLWDRTIWRSGSSAVIVFVDRASAQATMTEIKRARKEAREIPWRSDSKPKLGIERYRAHHALRYPPPSVLQGAVNSHLTAFAELEANRTRLLSRQRSQPDADGFVTVTRGGRIGPARIEAAQEVAKRLKERQEKMAGGNFYRFQTRERNKARLVEIKKGFQEDRRRLEDIRAKKRIKPM